MRSSVKHTQGLQGFLQWTSALGYRLLINYLYVTMNLHTNLHHVAFDWLVP